MERCCGGAGPIIGLVFVALAVGVSARTWQLTHPVAASEFAGLGRDAVLAECREAAHGAAESVTPFCFQAEAPVVLGTGPDGQPGVAGEDDNFNGIIDERSEIGAVGSDDTCLAPADDGHRRSLEAPDSLVLSRGAFVPCENAADAARFRVPGLGWLIGPFHAQESPQN